MTKKPLKTSHIYPLNDSDVHPGSGPSHAERNLQQHIIWLYEHLLADFTIAECGCDGAPDALTDEHGEAVGGIACYYHRNEHRIRAALQTCEKAWIKE